MDLSEAQFNKSNFPYIMNMEIKRCYSVHKSIKTLNNFNFYRLDIFLQNNMFYLNWE